MTPPLHCLEKSASPTLRFKTFVQELREFGFLVHFGNISTAPYRTPRMKKVAGSGRVSTTTSHYILAISPSFAEYSAQEKYFSEYADGLYDLGVAPMWSAADGLATQWQLLHAILYHMYHFTKTWAGTTIISPSTDRITPCAVMESMHTQGILDSLPWWHERELLLKANNRQQYAPIFFFCMHEVGV